MKYQDLSDKAKSHALNKYVEHIGNFDWWEWVYETAKEDGLALGFHIDEINFSGFGSQGDGASWNGSVDVVKFLETHLNEKNPDYSRYFILLQLASNGWAEPLLIITNRGHYSHEGTMRIYDRTGLTSWCSEDDEVVRYGVLTGASVKELQDAIDLESLEADLEDWVLQEAKDYAKKIYVDLKAEYEHMTSEESLIEHAEANDYDFNEEGELV